MLLQISTHRTAAKLLAGSLNQISYQALLPSSLFSSQDHTLTFTPPQVPPAQIPQAQTQPPQQNSVPPGGFGGADLTGNGAAKAARAALSKYPGSIERVTAGPSGGYVVHVFTADGYEVHVLVSNGFKVLGSDGGGGPPPGAAPQGGSTKSS